MSAAVTCIRCGKERATEEYAREHEMECRCGGCRARCWGTDERGRCVGPATSSRKNCKACAFCYAEPDDDFTCGHPDAGTMGIYTKHASAEGGHCGPNRPKFEQHPGRNPDGTLKD